MSSVGFKVFAIVPARGGSKGFPGKNLALFGSHTLVEQAVNIAKTSEAIQAVYVSSDSLEILQIGERAGARQHLRSSQLSSDSATATDVVRDLIPFLISKEKATASDFILYLQPTSPLRTNEMVIESIRLASAGHKAVISISETPSHPMKSFTISENGKCVPFFKEEQLSANRQDLPRTYFADGNVFLFEIGHFLTVGSFPVAGAACIFSPPGRGTDIDSELDLKYAEFLIAGKYL